jgi:hypothetical protein
VLRLTPGAALVSAGPGRILAPPFPSAGGCKGGTMTAKIRKTGGRGSSSAASAGRRANKMTRVKTPATQELAIIDPLQNEREPLVTQSQVVGGTAAMLTQMVLLAMATPGATLVGLAGAFMSTAVGIGLTAALATRASGVAEMWGHMRTGPGDGGPTEAQFDGFVADNVGSPEVQAVLLESVRKGLEAVDPAAYKPLAYLSRHYTCTKQSPDDFFRGASGFLVSSPRRRIDLLRRLVRAVIARTDSDEVMLHADAVRPIVRIDRAELYRGGIATTEAGQLELNETADELLHALDTHRLVRITGGGASEVSALARRDVFERLKLILHQPRPSRRRA